MAPDQLGSTLEDLERQELEAPNGKATPEVYEKLLGIYLYQNDVCNAKYLWKRIPLSAKSSTPELAQMWTVGQHMWKRDFPLVYKALNAVTWTETVADIMAQVQANVRRQAVNLIAKAYSSISLQTVALMTGVTAEVAAKSCTEHGWYLDGDTEMVYPVVPQEAATAQISSEDQLYKLTDFVSFLEN